MMVVLQGPSIVGCLLHRIFCFFRSAASSSSTQSRTLSPSNCCPPDTKKNDVNDDGDVDVDGHTSKFAVLRSLWMNTGLFRWSQFMASVVSLAHFIFCLNEIAATTSRKPSFSSPSPWGTAINVTIIHRHHQCRY